MTKAEKLKKLYDERDSRRSNWTPLWDDVRNYVDPRKGRTRGKTTEPDKLALHRLFDITPGLANQEMAAGCMEWLTPANQRWFQLDPPRQAKGEDAAEDWCARASDSVREALSGSNYYTEIHEDFLECGAFGTSCLIEDSTDTELINFQVWPISEYVIAENASKYVNAVQRKYNLTASQAVELFGDKVPDIVKADIRAGRPDNRHEFLHSVIFRPESERKGKGFLGMPYGSVYQHFATSTIVKEGGFAEMAPMVWRWQRWGDDPYGISPGIMALPEARQLNILEEDLDTLANVAANPRILVPAGHRGPIDLRAKGVTQYMDQNNKPTEWLTGGDYKIGVDRSERRRQTIERVFMLDLFRAFAQLDKQMTAREIAAREAEKLTLFSPMFGRWTTERGGPVVIRTFNILYRAGQIPPPPPSMLAQTPNGPRALMPKVKFTSKIALALEALRVQGFVNTVSLAADLAEFAPELRDNLDLDKGFRRVARSNGVDPDDLIPEIDRDKMREARAAAQQEQAIQQAAMQPAVAKELIGRVADGQIQM